MPNPIRILQIIGLLDRGGVEVWLMNVLRNIDRSEFQIDFLVHVDYPCAFDDEARQLVHEFCGSDSRSTFRCLIGDSCPRFCAIMGHTIFFIATCIYAAVSICKLRRVAVCLFKSPIRMPILVDGMNTRASAPTRTCWPTTASAADRKSAPIRWSLKMSSHTAWRMACQGGTAR